MPVFRFLDLWTQLTYTPFTFGHDLVFSRMQFLGFLDLGCLRLIFFFTLDLSYVLLSYMKEMNQAACMLVCNSTIFVC